MRFSASERTGTNSDRDQKFKTSRVSSDQIQQVLNFTVQLGPGPRQSKREEIDDPKAQNWTVQENRLAVRGFLVEIGPKSDFHSTLIAAIKIIFWSNLHNFGSKSIQSVQFDFFIFFISQITLENQRRGTDGFYFFYFFFSIFLSIKKIFWRMTHSSSLRE